MRGSRSKVESVARARDRLKLKTNDDARDGRFISLVLKKKKKKCKKRVMMGTGT